MTEFGECASEFHLILADCRQWKRCWKLVAETEGGEHDGM